MSVYTINPEGTDVHLLPKEYTAEETRHIVRCPSGECPIKLKDIWDLQTFPPETIIWEYFWRIRNLGLQPERREFYTAGAIAYWGQYEFDSTTPEYEEFRRIVFDYAKIIGDYKWDDGTTDKDDGSSKPQDG